MSLRINPSLIKFYAVGCHQEVNHLYDKKPYVVHLECVVNIANRFIHLIPDCDRNDVLAACWCHDLIEDCRQSYNDVKGLTNKRVADLVFAVTTEKGKNRKQRANYRYYRGIRNTPYATFVKLCDRIANYEYSLKNKSRMADTYQKEMSEFIEKLYTEQYTEMFDRLQTPVIA